MHSASRTAFAVAAMQGGPTYVANSNWPLRGGKWTSWEGGTHLSAFVHHGGGLLPPKRFTGLAHHADWVPTLVEAGGGTLNDSAMPPLDGVSIWKALLARDDSPGPRDHIVVNVDVTNQAALNDIGGWSGYAGVVVRSQALGHYKLVLGDPGTPNSWCWPNNASVPAADPDEADASAWATGWGHLLDMEPGAVRVLSSGRDGPATAEMRPGNGQGREDSLVLRIPDVHARSGPYNALDATAAHALATCDTLPGFTAVSKSPGFSAKATTLSACCDACYASNTCVAWTFTNATEPGRRCQLLTAAQTKQRPVRCANCVTGNNNRGSPLPQPWRDPMPDPTALSCGYNGHVPANRTGPILFNLAADPTERVNLAGSNPDRVAALMAVLQPYLDSAVPPLNELPAERAADPRAEAAAKAAGAWVPWLP